MGAELYQIGSREDAALDTTRIMVLRQSLGDQRCREIVSEVVFHLTDRLGLLQTALAAGDAAEAQVLASRLASLSEQVGPRRLRPGGARPRHLPHRRRRDRHRRGRGAADAAGRGFALLGHSLRRSIGLVADPRRACRVAARFPLRGIPSMPLAAAPDPRAVPLRLIASDGLPDWLAGQDAPTRAWVAAHGLRGGASARSSACRGRTARCSAALAGWGTAAARRRDRFPLAAAAAKLPAGRYALAPEGVEIDATLEALGWLLADYRFGRYRAGKACRGRARLPRRRRRRAGGADRRCGGAGAGSDQHARPRHGARGAGGGLRGARRAARRRGAR